ncbi:hypothetical protein ACNF49_37390 [Actinomadura sp. ATCC 39365]
MSPTGSVRTTGATPGDVRRLGGLLTLGGSLAGGALYVVTHLGGPLPQGPALAALVTYGGSCRGRVPGGTSSSRRWERPAWRACGGPAASVGYSSFAALAAAGVPERAPGGVLVRQAVVAALPVCVVAAVSGVAVVVLTVVTVYRVESPPWAVTRAVLMAGVGVLAAVVVALAARPLLRGALRAGART